MTAAEFQALPETFKSEFDMQKTLVKWLVNEACTVVQGRFFAIPNGANKNRASAGKAKAEGQKPGVPDLIFYGPQASTLWVEMKNGPKSKPSPEQLDFHLSLRNNGHEIHVAHSIEAAKQVITEFYSFEPQ